MQAMAFGATTLGTGRFTRPASGSPTTNMGTKERSRYTNPRLREVEQSIAERAYTLRRYVKQGSPEYQRLSWAIQGNCSLATLALLVELDAKHEAGTLADALSRSARTAPGAPALTNPSDE